MKVVLAPDKYSGTLRAHEVAAAMREGWSRARPGDQIAACPMADGGEGLLDVVSAAQPGAQRRTIEVVDARGFAAEASWLLLGDGLALIEAAQAVGLARLDPELRTPRLATSYGVGQLLADAAASGARHVLVGLGGSATVDGGAGMATALGHRLLREDGNGVKVGAEFLTQLDRIELGPPLGISVRAAVDVQSPLLGPEGAVAVFAPQKGASAEDLPVLEDALRRWADVVERDVPGGPWRDAAGAGAAGGLGFGLAAFTKAALVSGAEAVGELVGLDAALRGADVVVTGEGKLDAQTVQGKVPAYVAGRGRAHGARVFAIAGQIADGAEGGFDAAAGLGPEGMTHAAELVAARAEELARRIAP